MKCINCGSKTKISNSRPFARGYEKWRRHNCIKCSTAFTTRELVDYEASFNVVKRSGKNEPFIQAKLLISIYKALDHRLAAQKDAGALSLTILNKLLPAPGLSISSEVIAHETLNVLKRFDPVGAVKYQSQLTPQMNARDLKKAIS
jgi:transcriptional regulator NrdR family protein